MSQALQSLVPAFSGLADLEARLAQNWQGEEVPKKQGRPPAEGEAKTSLERQKATRARANERRQRNIAILDMETDPFDAELKADIKPFLAVLYSDEFEPIVIWEENFGKFIGDVVSAISGLPDRWTIYAHNGGKFDFLFLVSKLRGDVKFKGRSLMSARIGEHELRDSSHIIPERLAAFAKDKFDYSRNLKQNRDHWRKQIIDYCIADCRYTLDIVKSFVANYGLKLTIGQAAMGELRKHYDVKKINAGFDKQLRQFYFGGRVECLQGRGRFSGPYKLYDVNSMYPAVMANCSHPIGDFNDYDLRRTEPDNDTVFVDLICRNHGALIGRDEGGFTTATIPYGRFRTTIWEFNVAKQYGLIEDVEIIASWNCRRRTTFSNFILPLYDNRLKTKDAMREMKDQGLQTTAAFLDLKKDDIFFKLLLNNSYGKFAMNPENYKEHYITDPDKRPDEEWFKSIGELCHDEQIGYLQPIFSNSEYAIWQKPSPGFRYNNVGTAASITGAARAVLLAAIQNSEGALYCDTDSIICSGLSGVSMHKSELGAWDLEDEFTDVIINGKKLYAVWHKKPKILTAEQIDNGQKPEYTVKSKGTGRITWNEMLAMLNGENIVKINRAPTLTKFSTQTYMQRSIRATASVFSRSENHHGDFAKQNA
jgi:DNA polymerase type B, organellar and viral